jgi:hypothetical protein
MPTSERVKGSDKGATRTTGHEEAIVVQMGREEALQSAAAYRHFGRVKSIQATNRKFAFKSTAQEGRGSLNMNQATVTVVEERVTRKSSGE